jgi:hypothetical protein
MNIELAEKVREAIFMDPESHDQGEYGRITDCGTIACIAGHTLLQDGYTVKLTKDNYTQYSRPDGSAVGFEFEEARELLGLTSEEAQALFYCMNNEEAIDMLEGYIKDARNQ